MAEKGRNALGLIVAVNTPSGLREEGKRDNGVKGREDCNRFSINLSEDLNHRWRVFWTAKKLGDSSASNSARAKSYNRLERLLKSMGFTVLQGPQETEDRLFRTRVLAIPTSVMAASYTRLMSNRGKGSERNRDDYRRGDQENNSSFERKHTSQYDNGLNEQNELNNKKNIMGQQHWSAMAFDFELDDSFHTKVNLASKILNNCNENFVERGSVNPRGMNISPESKRSVPEKSLEVCGMASFRADCLLHRGWMPVLIPLTRWEVVEEHSGASQRLIELCMAEAERRAATRLDDDIAL
eukprot:CAMPEP_0175039946 /NCGR_PEP_ID=MMETSP0052_2-20121109/937_1 /TAXON_ID=51329 ORGANISM="Polytomella parva, Strain SAG 63-3" /NCGR_SAMPLE_ID=MMETSP0052_2 /ASSEMBLY_ACC=CAM_ASM_000194 /LENGTH=296 /DNA_ID=CAMNT_0016301997 /DNA_START=467 /DNA_END=1356 /DNA_ORIENTATION=+